MNTQSHVLINSALGKQLERRGIRPMYWALAIGSFMPDVPLTILTGIYMYNRRGDGATSPQEIFGPAYDALYFSDPVWIIGHSVMHSPPMIALYLLIGWYFGFRKGRVWAQWVFWFAVGNGLHSALDIPTHHHDGPLLLFPFNWNLRFVSPVSYWDPNHYGRIFMPISVVLDLFLLGYFIREWLQRRKRRGQLKTDGTMVAAPDAS